MFVRVNKYWIPLEKSTQNTLLCTHPTNTFSIKRTLIYIK